MTDVIENEIPNQLALMLTKKMKLTSSPKQEKIFTLNLPQSNNTLLEKLIFLYPSIPKEVRINIFNYFYFKYQKLSEILSKSKFNLEHAIEIIKNQINENNNNSVQKIHQRRNYRNINKFTPPLQIPFKKNPLQIIKENLFDNENLKENEKNNIIISLLKDCEEKEKNRKLYRNLTSIYNKIICDNSQMTKTGIEIYEQNKILKKKNDDLKKEFITKYKELKKIRENVQNTIDLNNFLQEKINELENI